MAINDNIKFNLNQYTGAVPDRMKKDLISRGCSGALNDMFKCYNTDTGRNYLKDMSLPVAPREFITANGTSTEFTMQNVVTLAGDFKISGKFSTTDTTSSNTIIAGSLASNNEIVISIVPTGKVRAFAFVGTTVQTIIESVLSYNDGKLHRVELDHSGTTATLLIDGVAVDSSTWALDGNQNVRLIGKRANSTSFFDGVIANVKLTDLTTPSNSESWKLDRPFPITTEQSSSGSNLLTYVNADASTRELFTLIDGDWFGAELVVNGGFNTDLSSWTIGAGGGWTQASGEAIGTSLDSFNKSLSQNNIFISGRSYQVKYTGTADTGSFGLQNNSAVSFDPLGDITPSRNSVSVIWQADTTQFLIKRFTNVNNATWDNVSVKRILEVA